MSHNIKSNRPKRNSQYDQGYIPLNECKKYKGNPPVIYRSSWEKRFCMYCETNPNIKWWTSESISIPYFNPYTQKAHQYFPDFTVELENGKRWIVEVKPKHETLKPKPPKRKTMKTVERYKRAVRIYVINVHKFEAARKYASSVNAEFVLVTEDFFKPTFR